MIRSPPNSQITLSPSFNIYLRHARDVALVWLCGVVHPDRMRRVIDEVHVLVEDADKVKRWQVGIGRTDAYGVVAVFVEHV